MNVLLDHCVDWRLARHLPGHEVKSAGEMGWDKLRNGVLLAAAARDFDVLLTVDRNIRHQQNPQALPIAVLIVVVPSNKLSTMLPLTPQILAALAGIKPRQFHEVGGAP